MIKKIIFLALLVAAGYVGYRIWNNLSPKEKSVVSGQLDKTMDGAKKLLDKTADKLTDKAKGAIDDMDKKTAKKKDGQDESASKPEVEKETDAGEDRKLNPT